LYNILCIVFETRGHASSAGLPSDTEFCFLLLEGAGFLAPCACRYRRNALLCKRTYHARQALLPLYLLTGLSFSAFNFEPDEMEQRYNTIATYFLAAFSMMYVVGEAMPKTDFLCV
jgi:hypothetical protein